MKCDIYKNGFLHDTITWGVRPQFKPIMVIDSAEYKSNFCYLNDLEEIFFQLKGVTPELKN